VNAITNLTFLKSAVRF